LNFTVEWLAFLLNILEVLDSKLGPETAVLIEVLMISLRPSRQMMITLK
jgi:hypothetical protein